MVSKVTQAVILAGGKGTRLAPITNSLPKPMVEVNGKPFLAHLLSTLADHGVSKVLILTGYLGHKIQAYFGDSYAGLCLSYAQEDAELSPGERILAAASLIDDKFVLLYGDNFVKFKLDALGEIQQREQSDIVWTIHEKSPGNISLTESGSVSSYCETRNEETGKFVELGFSLISKSGLLDALKKSSGDLGKAFEHVAKAGRAAALVVQHPYWSVSDPDRLALARIALGERKVVILDRDGVLNVKPDRGEYVSEWSDFVKISSTWEALHKLGKLGFEFIIITNQAGINRGIVRQSQLDHIHAEMINALANVGAHVLGVYVCPHHWDENCGCRKPKAGLFYQAARDHLLMLDRVIYVGDDPTDEVAALSCGAAPVMLNRDPTIFQKSENVFPDLLTALPKLRRFYASHSDTR